ncbi:MAG: hypothetical protein JSW71_23830 [Gemmatimonadota bacterium]|nr:MAG: hypothetical protein JSW71_23830 [Gemmatimonadota bacterium]
MMVTNVRRIFYYHMKVVDQPGEAYKRLAQLKGLGVSLVAFAMFPEGPAHTRLTIFPDDAGVLSYQAKKAGMKLDGPHPALLVQGSDQLGALEEIHQKLYDAHVNVSASAGAADGKGGYGYILYVKPDEYDRAVSALEL